MSHQAPGQFLIRHGAKQTDFSQGSPTTGNAGAERTNLQCLSLIANTMGSATQSACQFHGGAALSDMTGIQQCTITHWERTGKLAERKEILELAKALKVPIPELLREKHYSGQE